MLQKYIHLYSSKQYSKKMGGTKAASLHKKKNLVGV